MGYYVRLFWAPGRGRAALWHNMSYLAQLGAGCGHIMLTKSGRCVRRRSAEITGMVVGALCVLVEGV